MDIPRLAKQSNVPSSLTYYVSPESRVAGGLAGQVAEATVAAMNIHTGDGQAIIIPNTIIFLYNK
jgi:hypothetical protein